MTSPSGDGCGGSSSEAVDTRARTRRRQPTLRVIASTVCWTSAQYAVACAPLGSPALNTAWSAERASAPTRVATSAPPGASANDAASARADSLRVARAPAGRRRSRAVSSTSSQPPATRATGSGLRRRRRRRRALSAMTTSRGDASSSSGIAAIPAARAIRQNSALASSCSSGSSVWGCSVSSSGGVTAAGGGGGGWTTCGFGSDGFSWSSSCGVCSGGRRRVERHPAVALERDLDPRLHVLAGDLDGPVRRPPRSGTKPSTTRAGSPISRTISAIAAAYCSPSPTMRSPPSSDVIRSAPWPDSDSRARDLDAVAEVALLGEPRLQRLADLHRAARVARHVRGGHRGDVRHPGERRLGDVGRGRAAHLRDGRHARHDDVDAVLEPVVHAPGEHGRRPSRRCSAGRSPTSGSATSNDVA